MATNTRKKPGTRLVSPILLIVFGAIAAALIAAMVLSPGKASSSDTTISAADEYGHPTISGDSLPPFPTGASASTDPAIGMVAPEVNGHDFDGSAVSITPDGTPKAVVFIAHWCPHCRNEVPRVQQWINSGGGVAGVDLISVTTALNPQQVNWPPSQWLKNEGWTQPNLRDDQASSVLNAYGGSSFPFWVFLKGDGTVALRMAGETDISTLQTAMESLLNAG